MKLNRRFSRLFNLSSQKSCCIADMSVWRDGNWNWNFSWRRQLFDREKIWIDDLTNYLISVELKENMDDRWIWEASNDGNYSVKSAFLFLQEFSLDGCCQNLKNMWKVAAPSNVSAFVWRLFRDRIQIKTNLKKRGIILNEDDVICAFCGSAEESKEHLFFTCHLSQSVWKLCYGWFGFDTVLPKDCYAHFQQHVFAIANRKCWKFAWSVWFASVWVIWLERNMIIFQNGHTNAESMLLQIKFKSWNWVKANSVNFKATIAEWELNPISCLNSL